jgi:hypothetical protein
MVLSNAGATPDRLVSASSSAARSVEIHQTRVGAGGMMEMQALPGGVTIPARGDAVFAPGGLHLMVVGLNQVLHEGDVVPITLTFEHAGAVEILAMVERPSAAHMQHGGHMH